MATEPELVFVDDKGGALAALGASLAEARGARASALSTTALRVFPEVSEVLAEIGVDQLVSARQAQPPGEADGRRLVVLGASAIAGSRPALEVHLYEGPPITSFGNTDLERRALARIARDRLERWLDRR